VEDAAVDGVLLGMVDEAPVELPGVRDLIDGTCRYFPCR
jgi:hypothetical protein